MQILFLRFKFVHNFSALLQLQAFIGFDKKLDQDKKKLEDSKEKVGRKISDKQYRS